jgi:hypothetical protein
MARYTFGLKYLKMTGKVLFLGVFLLIFSLPKIIFADPPPVAEQVTVSAFVDSDVNGSNSSLTADPLEILADGNETSTITVTVRDDANNPLANLKVVVSSNRGAIDTIEPAQANTNIVGEASFTIRSATAGKATVSAFVDNAVTLDDTATITFTKPPSPTPITVTTTIPPMFGMPGRTITLFKPAAAEENPLVESGMELQIPFAIFLLGSAFVVSQPILLSIIVVQSVAYRRRDHKIMEQQEEIMDQEENLVDKIDGHNQNHEENNE